MENNNGPAAEEAKLARKIRESQRSFMMTEVPLNIALKRIKEVQEVLPQMQLMKERLDNQEEILRSHEERVRHAMDKRDLWV